MHSSPPALAGFYHRPSSYHSALAFVEFSQGNALAIFPIRGFRNCVMSLIYWHWHPTTPKSTSPCRQKSAYDVESTKVCTLTRMAFEYKSHKMRTEQVSVVCRTLRGEDSFIGVKWAVRAHVFRCRFVARFRH